MTQKLLDAERIRRALALRDLSDPDRGPHAMQILVDDVVTALAQTWGCAVRILRHSAIVSVQENYDALHYPPSSVARDARYTRYLNRSTILRTQTSALIPRALRDLDARNADDVLLVCPGLVYRRDSIDRLHTGEPHQLDLWRIRRGRLEPTDLVAMIHRVVDALLPGRTVQTTPAEHPYTTHGLQIDVAKGDEWVEVGECGMALPALLAEQGHDPAVTTGLAMGLGLDRILMLRKGIDDIRLLRSEDPRITAQLQDLEPYRPVSNQPAVVRDLSVAVADDADAEELGERVRVRLGPRAECVEAVTVISETPRAELPAAAAARLGIQPDQKNVLLRVVIRHLTRSLTHAEANVLRDEIYAAVHEGAAAEWASEGRNQ